MKTLDKIALINKIQLLRSELNSNIKLLEAITPKLFNITSYSQVCEVLREEELSVSNFRSNKEFRTHQLEKIERLYNKDWIPDWSNKSETKHYPTYEIRGSGLVFDSSIDDSYYFLGQVASFRNKKTSDYVGKTFKDIYEGLLFNR